MATSEVISRQQDLELKVGCLAVSITSGAVILVTGACREVEFSGVVVHGGKSRYPIGHCSDDFIKSNFIRLKGSVTLTEE